MAKNKHQNMTISRFFCTECGNEGISIMRKEGSQREAGHLKKLFCICCGHETNHSEVQAHGSYTPDSFREEFELGRFIDGQRIPVADLLSCSKTDCCYNRDGKCWNSNHSYKCKYRGDII